MASRQRLLPRPERGTPVDARTEFSDRPTNLLVEIDQRATATVPRAGMRSGHVDIAEGEDERSEIGGGLVEIIDRADGVLTRQPFVDRPVERIPLGGPTHRSLHRYGERHVWRDPGQPLAFLRCLRGGPADARQAGDELITHSVDVVVRPVRLHFRHVEIRQVGKLIGEQALDQRNIGGDLVGMHLHRRHPRLTRCLRQEWGMGLFSRGPEKVINDGQRVRGRIVAIEVSERNDNDSTRRVDEYVIETTVADGGRRLSVRQDLIPDAYVRYGMEVSAWVRGNDMYIDWKATMAEKGIDGTNAKDAWKGERDASRTGITDSKVGVADALKKGERGSMIIKELRWDSKFGGLINTLTIAGTVTLGTDEPYDVEIGRQNIPHYASHLPAVGRTVPVVVSVKRLDKVTIDWPSAAMAEPGIGADPSTAIEAARETPRTMMSMGGGDAAWTPPAPSAAFVPPAPIEGVSWAQYLTIEKAILDAGGYNRKTGELVETFGVSFATYTKASAAFGKLQRRDVVLQQSFTAAVR